MVGERRTEPWTPFSPEKVRKGCGGALERFWRYLLVSTTVSYFNTREFLEPLFPKHSVAWGDFGDFGVSFAATVAGLGLLRFTFFCWFSIPALVAPLISPCDTQNECGRGDSREGRGRRVCSQGEGRGEEYLYHSRQNKYRYKSS